MKKVEKNDYFLCSVIKIIIRKICQLLCTLRNTVPIKQNINYAVIFKQKKTKHFFAFFLIFPLHPLPSPSQNKESFFFHSTFLYYKMDSYIVIFMLGFTSDRKLSVPDGIDFRVINLNSDNYARRG